MQKFLKDHITVISYTALAVMGVIYYLPHLKITGIPLYPYEDGLFHLSRIIGMSNVWKSPVNFLNFHHNGLMINLCYPWLTMYPAYLLYKLLGSYITAYKAFYLLLTVGTLFLAYKVMLNISGNRLSAFCFSVLFTYSSYRFENLFHRSALGEVIAITLWLPVFFGLYHIFFGNYKYRGVLAAGMALFAYTHNLSLLIASLVTGTAFLITVWFWDRKRERILSLIIAGGTAVLLSLGSLYPMLELFSTDKLQIPGGTGLSLERSVFDLPTLFGKMLHNETSAHSVGLLVFLALVCLCLFFILRALKAVDFERNKGIDLFALTGILVMFAVSDLLPWEWIGDRTFLRQLQFVWRLNTCPTVFILAAFAYYLPKVLRPRRALILVPVIICIAAAGIHYRTFLDLYRQDHTRILEEQAASGDAASMDYAPLRAKQYRDETHVPYLDGIPETAEGPVHAEIRYEENGSVYTAVLQVPGTEGKTVTVDLPVFRYSTQQCTVNGGPAETSLSERGGTLVTVPAGQTSEVRIFYRYTARAVFARAVSGTAFFVFILPDLIRLRKKKGS